MIRGLLVVISGLLVGSLPSTARPIAYTEDANTLILYHLDATDGSAVANAAAGDRWHGVVSLAPGATVSPVAGITQAGFPGFGGSRVNAANQGVGVDVNGNGTWSFDTVEPGDRWSMAQLGTQFTFEALVNLPSLAAGNQHLWGGDGNTQRAFQWRIENGGVLRFDPDPGGTSVAFDLSTVQGTHAFVPDRWYHVAVTHDATAGTAGAVTRFYWTRLDSGATSANLIHTSAAGAVALNGALSAPLVLGNEGRANTMGETLGGLIDEARVSNVARKADEFVFRSVGVSASTGAWESANPPSNTVDGNTATRASAAGDGASITWRISGTPVVLDSIGMAFFNGDLRAYRFDVLVSRDGVTWSTALAGATSGGKSLDLEAFDVPGNPVASWVRIVGHGYNGNPDAFNSYTEFAVNPALATVVDTDDDGLPDPWETQQFGSLVQGPYGDVDGDGSSNLEEFLAGTPPGVSSSHPLWESPRVEALGDSVLTPNARLFAASATYGRAINGISYQDQVLLTHDGRQYTAWYDQASAGVYLARRAVTGRTVGPWEVHDTGSALVNGLGGDAHNVISLGICGADGTLHMAWDHHGHNLRYRRSVVGLCGSRKEAWGTGMLLAEQNWLVAPGQTVTLVTYPMFIASPSGGLLFQWRYGSSGSGANFLASYDPGNAAWNAPLQFDSGAGTYVEGSYSSTSRNAYLNGFDVAPDGRIHISWTWREGAGTSNHDICHASSHDLGLTWQSGAGTRIADTTLGQRIHLGSPGIRVRRKDMKQLLINQQSQCVDGDGRLHLLMLHRREDPGHEYPNQTTALFSILGTAYYHYFRDPGSGQWAQRRIPPDIAPVGSRPSLGYDAEGNLYAVYLTYADRSQVYPGYRGGQLAVATASKASSYSDWRVVHTSTTRFHGEPKLDQARLRSDAILSVFVQEDSASTAAVGTPLHVLEFAVMPGADPDSDRDGLPDAWETTAFGSVAAQDGSGDADGDRTVNRVEYLLGLAPLDGSSCFVASLEGGTLAWPGAEGVSFAVERSTDMFQWSVIATRVGTAGRNAFVDPAPPAGRAFYRVRLVP